MRLRELYASIRQFHENPRLISFASSPAGSVIVWLLATLLLWPSGLSHFIPFILLLVQIRPQRAELILCLGSAWVLYDMLISHGAWGPVTIITGALIILSLLYLIFMAARSYQGLPGPVHQHPLIILHLIILTGLTLLPVFHNALSTFHPGLSRVITAIVLMSPFFAWRVGYLLLSARKRQNKLGNFMDHLYYFLPIFGGTNVPYGKGRDYLLAKRAHGPEQFAKSQLAGLKLLVLAWLWLGVMEAMDIGVYGEKGRLTSFALSDFHPAIFHLRTMMLGEAPQHIPIYMAWEGVFLDLIYATLDLAIFGHFIIGCLRLFGFNVFRNTYKPLLAQSLVDFWNRYYYYFKELLVDFFFYPTFLTYFKSRPKIRIFAAIMMAAFLGNTYYHLLEWLAWGQVSFLSGKGLWTQLVPYLFYTFLLGLGVFVSMLREQKRRGKPQQPSTYPWLHSIRRIAGVWIFFGLIRIWDVGPLATFGERMVFFSSLFGM